ncbi:hypothetical protein [Lentzea flava]|uniref:Lipoprotein n=1 Tax=Lentzea flava TaxID=103732 RepID=A0ABQ2UR41_9PSEU|nr:hypothetical protein [Lentzea flava]MCP2201243.1 hypothetical protein [Lentzea flava]GGU49625.1 hypothetical protein GCM10010178_48020 [Lentzea flava]
MRTPLLAAVLTGAVVLTACGSDEDKPLTDAQGQWVDAFCGGLLPGMKAGQELKGKDPADPAGIKTAYLNLISANTTAFTDAEKKLTELGPPSDELKDVHDRLTKYFAESARSYAAARGPVEKLEPNAGFWENAEQVLTETSQVSSPEDLRATFDALERSPKYAAALDKAGPCSGLRTVR